MSPYRRNILVGICVIGALVILGWMILQFGEAPARLFTKPAMAIHFKTDRADGLSEGSVITYRGVNVGHITTVTLTDDKLSVIVDGKVDTSPRLPANIEGVIRSQGLIGGGSQMVLVPLRMQPPQGTLAAGATIPARFVGLDVLPPEFAELATELRLTAKQFRESNIVGHMDTQIEKAGKILDSLDKLVSDPKLHEDLKVAMANIRQATASASKIGKQFEQTSLRLDETLGDVRTTVNNTNKSIDSVSKQMGDRLTQIAKTLDHLDSITSKIDNGKGTVGQLVNDPKLYQSLVDTARELNATVSDFKRLAEQWEQEGISFKLK